MTMQLIGVDLGGTQIRAALASSDGVMERRVATLTLADEGPDAVIERICAQIELAREGGTDRCDRSWRTWTDRSLRRRCACGAQHAGLAQRAPTPDSQPALWCAGLYWQ